MRELKCNKSKDSSTSVSKIDISVIFKYYLVCEACSEG